MMEATEDKEREMERQELAFTSMEEIQRDYKKAVEHAKLSPAFKVHLIAGISLSAISFIVWLFVDFAVFHYPWFHIVVAFFAFTLAFHFYVIVKNKELLQLHFVWFLIFNVTIFLAWIFVGDEMAWFIYPLCITAAFFSIHFGMVRWKTNRHRFVYLHLVLFTIINTMTFLLWLDIKGGNWFVWPFFSLGLPLAIHWTVHYYPRHWLRLHVVIFADIQLLLFFTWVVAGLGFPWFTFPLVIWGIGLGIHGYIAKPPPAPATVSDVRVDLESEIGRHDQVSDETIEEQEEGEEEEVSPSYPQTAPQ